MPSEDSEPYMKRIFIVAMADSIHTARWLLQFRNQRIVVTVFPSGPHRRIHPLIRALVDGDQVMKVTIAPVMRFSSLPLYVSDKIFPLGLRARYLRYLIKKRSPSILHALETQHSGYIASQAISKLKIAPEFRLSIWGSDLVWFSRFRRHRREIRNVLSRVDQLSVECTRDVELARSLGFDGKVLPALPASGGVDLSAVQISTDSLAPHMRRKIVVKGYSGFVGRATTSLRVLEVLASQLMDYEIHVYSASRKTSRLVRRIVKRTGLAIVSHPKHSLTHQEVLSLFQDARISISISLSDGFPGSLREAMVSGCFPIESLKSCGAEWAITDKSAFFVDPLNEGEIATAVARALNDDNLVDSAARLNWELAQSRFSTLAVKDLVNSYYLKSN